mmetsp:Transcript_4440/g.10867  ORF Transcript_4440/g.10867 Transcript_4440/m.10867 type:complete len:264 (+) Transcript_4440:1339-2130(+)
MVLHSCVTVARRGRVPVPHDWRPLRASRVEFPEVVHSVVSVVSAEDVERVFVRHDHVPVPYRGRVLRLHLAPLLPLEVEFVQIVDAVGPVVPAENPEAVVEDDAHVERALSGRGARVFHELPLLQKGVVDQPGGVDATLHDPGLRKIHSASSFSLFSQRFRFQHKYNYCAENEIRASFYSCPPMQALQHEERKCRLVDTKHDKCECRPRPPNKTAIPSTRSGSIGCAKETDHDVAGEPKIINRSSSSRPSSMLKKKLFYCYIA